jgi:hypothetical protein
MPTTARSSRKDDDDDDPENEIERVMMVVRIMTLVVVSLKVPRRYSSDRRYVQEVVF